MSETDGKSAGIGASVPRLEDDRYLRGRGRFVGDIKLPGMLDVAFVRSPIAHGRVRGIAKPTGLEASVFVMADLEGVSGIRADTALPGFRSSVQPILASEKVRHVGEPLAACIAATRAEAEDIAEQVALDLEQLPAVVDMTRARDKDAPRLHEHWPDNVFLEFGGGGEFRGLDQRRGGDRQAHLPHRAPEHGADGRPRCRRHLG